MTTTIEQRFAVKWIPEPNTGCWLWIGGLNSNGYGNLWDGRRVARAHRFSYETHVGPIPEGLQLDHLCRQRSCVNPSHLEPVTSTENTRRGHAGGWHNAAKTHCLRGHEYTPENTLRDPKGRSCRACGRERSRLYQARRRASS